jgi:methyl-accepting chemotaxis protein
MNGQLSQKRLTISKRFIITVAVIYSLLIGATAVTVNLAVRWNSEILKSALDEYTTKTIIYRSETAADALTLRRADSGREITAALRDFCSEEKGFLHAILYAKTADEEYYRVIESIPVSDAVPVQVAKDSVVREQKEINYLRAGLIHSTADPAVYSSNGQFWKNVYVPYESKSRRWVIQFMMTTHAAYQAMEGFNDSAQAVKIVTAVISAVLVIAVIVLTVLFLNNYSLLITNLSRYMNEAAQGNLQVSLNPAADTELQQLAVSFNSLIEEIKDIKDTQEKTASEAINAGDLFKTGVLLLKETKYEEASAAFRTLLMSGKYLFGSYFNLGVASAKLRRYDLSMEMFRKAREINPSHELTAQYIDKVQRLQSFNG